LGNCPKQCKAQDQMAVHNRRCKNQTRVPVSNRGVKFKYKSLGRHTSMKSFLYRLGPEYSREEFRLGGNIKQTFIFTRDIPNEKK
ncbi:MAG: hypothetical protein II838_14945, partial [Lachnospiraceae bacterium]|nr:hypothetical protein [Lachnospiraceae bacterium]